MRLFILFRSYLLVTLISTSFASDNTYQLPSVSHWAPPLFSRNSGLGMLGQHKSFLTSIVNVFYSLPMVQKTVFEEAERMKLTQNFNPITSYLALKLAAMRIMPGNVYVDSQFFKTLKAITQTDFESVIVTQLGLFLNIFVGELTRAIKDLFAIKLISLDGQNDRESVSIVVPLDRGELDLRSLARESCSASQIKNTPEVLVFSLNRFAIVEIDGVKNYQLHNTPIIVDQELAFGDADYIFAANIVGNFKKAEYSAFAIDFGNDLKYQYYPDGTAFSRSIPSHSSEKKDTDSLLVFFVKKESITKLKSSSDVLQAIRNNSDIPSSLLKSFNYRNGVSSNPTPSQESTRITKKRPLNGASKTEKASTPRILVGTHHQSFTPISPRQIDPSGLSQNGLDLISKLDNPMFELGAEDYSFKGFAPEMPYTAFELILSVLASSNSSFDFYIQLIESEKYRIIDFLVAKALAQMFLGMKNISIKGMVDEVCKIKALPKKLFYDDSNSYMLTCINSLISCFPSGVFDGLSVSMIHYEGLEGQNPLSVHQLIKYSPTTKKSIPFLPAAIDGVYTDSFNELSKGRTRHIFKTASLFLPIFINRTFSVDKGVLTFLPDSFFICPSKYKSIGMLCYDNFSLKSYKSWTINHAHKQLRLLKPGSISISTPVCSPHVEQSWQDFHSSSFCIFYKYIQEKDYKALLSSQIPEIIKYGIKCDLKQK